MLNARSAILHRLAMIFREKGQFDEESECMIVLRRYHRRLQLARGKQTSDSSTESNSRHPQSL